ncbi:uncharacterized protein LACBIDRAFT_315946 [Laccaria bicolor S238N-H82]|uniref:Predicted protein n=1 Tax=Laccaria bicolor (strain S238N-H82 / ATCC MYA-4686) TaxID=486041 RepID=B0D3J5_LACBS|nr:uncharacterized protein LACBIDRAFT_315946 [Laccaria bicolor S238N-H82]EDR10932.1 predicted protein [Laccaria bicolor S238N-H82]|eukprot:XP_001878233.1 predicted protein [Laccaria bicolor S238N-H82]
MQSFPWLRFTGLSVGLMGIGYALMKATTPTEEQLYNASTRQKPHFLFPENHAVL